MSSKSAKKQTKTNGKTLSKISTSNAKKGGAKKAQPKKVVSKVSAKAKSCAKKATTTGKIVGRVKAAMNLKSQKKPVKKTVAAPKKAEKKKTSVSKKTVEKVSKKSAVKKNLSIKAASTKHNAKKGKPTLLKSAKSVRQAIPQVKNKSKKTDKKVSVSVKKAEAKKSSVKPAKPQLKAVSKAAEKPAKKQNLPEPAKAEKVAAPKKPLDKSDIELISQLLAEVKKEPKAAVKKAKKASKVSEAPLSGLKIDEPAVKKSPKRQKGIRHSESIYFTLEDLDTYFKDRANGTLTHESMSRREKDVSVKKAIEAPKTKPAKKAVQNFQTASIADILGFNPVEVPTREKHVEKEIPRKWKKYYNMLVELRRKHSTGVTERSEEVLKRSAKEDSGDLSSYGQHLADAGSESFDRDMAFSLLSSEHEIIHEIDAAIDRMKKGTYGICEYTGAEIPEERLSSIPFTRYTKLGQERKELELKRVKSMQRTGFGDIPTEGASGGEEEPEA